MSILRKKKNKKEAVKAEHITEKDLHKEKFEALLTEYSCQREEAQHDDSHQIQLVTVTFSTLIALVGAAAAFNDKIPEKVSVFFSFVALPCLVMFMGLLWIDLIYRRIRFGCYTKILENKINSLLQSEEIMEWEHWIEKLEDGKELYNVTRYFRGYIVSGSWLVAPILIMGSYFLLGESSFCVEAREIWKMCVTHKPISFFMLVVYFIYYFFFAKYLQKIIKFPSMVK